MSILETPAKSKPRLKRTTGGATLGQESSREAKRLAAAILEVLAGQRTPTQAAQALSVSLPRYYQLEAGGLRGLLVACEPKPRGRQANLSADVVALRRQNERLQRDLTRQQSLVRLTQRVTGLTVPAPIPAKEGKKARKRKPVVRALTVADRLRQEAEQPSENGTSLPSE
jgi:uncharacterized protein (DUF2267 family)